MAVGLTTLVFDEPHDEAGPSTAAIASALATSDAPTPTPVAALVIRWDRADPSPHYQTIPVPGGLHAVLELIFTATFLVPLLAAATQQPARANSFPFEVLGLSVGFVNQLRDTVIPGTSAVLLLATAEQVDDVTDRTQQHRPSARIVTPLTATQLEAIRHAYGDEVDDPRASGAESSWT